MSEYKEFLEEKNKVDHYFDEGYEILHIKETLSGMFIEFTSPKEKSATLLLTTAEARKYIATILLYA